MRRRVAASVQTMLAICSPAVLNDFDGEFSTTAVSSTQPMGQKVWPGITSSQWISSLTMRTAWRRQMSLMRCSSSRLHTRPVGLWGLHSRKTVAFSSAQRASKSAQSTSKRYCPPCWLRTRVDSDTSQPLLRMLEKKQL